MKAIVCDKCGKVILLADGERYYHQKAIVKLINTATQEEMDLCDECAEELKAAVRKSL